MKCDTLIVGGGITGLTALHRARSAGTDAQLVEKSDRLGGTIMTVEAPWGGAVDLGPNSLRAASPELVRLIDELDLRDRVIAPDPSAKRRYILRSGRPVEVPSNPRSFIESDLLSARGKLRMVSEVFRRRGTSESESVADFVSRRLGSEVLDRLFDPFVTGIYAGDPEKLSIAATFPMLVDLERVHRSLLLGGLRTMRAKRREGSSSGTDHELPRIFSFDRGVGVLTDAIADRYSDRIRSGVEVERLDRSGELWSVSTSAGTIEANRVTITTNAPVTAGMIAHLDDELAEHLRSVDHAPVAVVSLAFDRSDLDEVPTGFGLLVPSSENRPILGIIYASSIFPDRYSKNTVVLTVMIGGSRRPETVGNLDDELSETAASEIAAILGITTTPSGSIVQRWEPGIPQYTHAHPALIASLERFSASFPGLRTAGSYCGGVSVPDRITAFG